MLNTTCQSCGLPMSNPRDYGTTETGAPSEDYCAICFEGGAFKRPKESQYEIIERNIPHVLKAGVCPDEESARRMLQMHIPTLKRWRKFQAQVNGEV